jgi:hypothetical protein
MSTNAATRIAAKERKEHKDKRPRCFFFVIFALHSVGITHFLEDFFAQRARRSAEKLQEKRSALSFFSAASAALRGTVPSGRVLVTSCRATVLSG